jgi:3-oxoacyl-[acyl-carrier protein] reductase
MEPMTNVTQAIPAPRSILMTDLSSHLALVTGATGGIGKATCQALADSGCSVAVHYHQKEPASTELVKSLRAKGVKAHTFQADLSDYEGVCML